MLLSDCLLHLGVTWHSWLDLSVQSFSTYYSYLISTLWITDEDWLLEGKVTLKGKLLYDYAVILWSPVLTLIKPLEAVILYIFYIYNIFWQIIRGQGDKNAIVYCPVLWLQIRGYFDSEVWRQRIQDIQHNHPNKVSNDIINANTIYI